MALRETTDTRELSFERLLVHFGRPPISERRLRLVSEPRLAALKRAGTSHVYADTADAEELRSLVELDADTPGVPDVRQHENPARRMQRSEPSTVITLGHADIFLRPHVGGAGVS
jgi:hypothetical protein